MKNRVTKMLILCIMVMGLCALPLTASATKTVSADKASPGSGNIFVGIEGSYETASKAKVLARINAIRKEAYEEGLVSKYVPMKWSKSLEKITQVRAAEATIKLGHDRPIGGWSMTTMKVGSVSSLAENVAYSTGGTIFDINQWYGEKANFKKKSGNYGHYQAITNPNYKYIAVATFNPKQSMNNGWNTTCANFASGSGLSESTLGISGSCIQMIAVPAKHVTAGKSITGTSSLNVGNSVKFKVNGSVKETGYMGSQTSKVILGSIKWTSSNKAVAKVSSSGKVTAVGGGTAKITAKGNGFTLTKKVTVAGLKTTAITKVTKAKKAFTVKWKKKSGITGYQVRYSTKSSMANAKKVKVKGAAKISKQVSNLKAKKKYYVQVRTYKVVNGKSYYSKWSTKKSVITK